jgi:UDP-N-acetylglucosamine--N-acetylmuramyl-(pentapeptide) pyrophosphoryl-undecaprenol N-acetylglucosamine transferase
MINFSLQLFYSCNEGLRMENRKIVMTGGGTAGHVTPNISLFESLRKRGFSIYYIGSKNGIEKQLIEKENIDYFPIEAGKLRRYFDFKNLTDAFRVMQGVFQSYSILGKIKPDIVFSKGGFVSCPVVWAAWLRNIPVVIHESDITPGLTNKLSLPFAKKVCYSFPESSKYIPEEKGVYTGVPVRNSILKGEKAKGYKLCGFEDQKPVIVVIGGSQGSENINKMVRKSLKKLLQKFNICHICGRNNIDTKYSHYIGYKQFEYLDEELAHIFSIADIFISRAGATAIFEFLALQKPALLIPLSRRASRGDQILNARSFQKSGFSRMIEEENITEESFLHEIAEVYKNREEYIKNMRSSNSINSVEKIIEAIENTLS